MQTLHFSGIPPIPSISNVVINARTAVQTGMQGAAPQVDNGNMASAIPPAAEVSQSAAGNGTAETENGPADGVTAENFETCWLELVEALFARKPAFYQQLKDFIPTFDNGTARIEVENDFQKRQLEQMKPFILEFWNGKFAIKMTDVEVIEHEHEKKRAFLTSEDKLKNMLEQNAELKDFLKILEFRMRD